MIQCAQLWVQVYKLHTQNRQWFIKTGSLESDCSCFQLVKASHLRARWIWQRRRWALSHQWHCRSDTLLTTWGCLLWPAGGCTGTLPLCKATVLLWRQGITTMNITKKNKNHQCCGDGCTGLNKSWNGDKVKSMGMKYLLRQRWKEDEVIEKKVKVEKDRRSTPVSDVSITLTVKRCTTSWAHVMSVGK